MGAEVFNTLARPPMRELLYEDRVRVYEDRVRRGRLARSLPTRATARPNAVFPAAIATDGDLLVGGNRVITFLTQGIGPNDTTIHVADDSLIELDMVVSLDRDGEIVKIVGPSVNRTFPVLRGFDSTVPVSHAPGALVLGNIVAWHHNALSAEIQAIERALGPDMSNIGTSGGIVPGRSYDFVPQSPAMNLVAGLNTIPLGPVPLGVSATDVNHYLYIDQGSGTPEAVKIIGGTALGGAATGTIVVDCSSPHTGNWRIRTATAGLQEAHNARPGAMIYYPDGVYQWYGPFWSNGNFTLMGAGYGQQGAGGTEFIMNSTTFPMFDIQRGGVILRQLHLRQNTASGVPQPGCIGIYAVGEGSTVPGANVNDLLIEDVAVFAFYNGILTDGGGQSINLSRVQVANCSSDGIVSRSSQGWWTVVLSENNGGNGITVTPATGAGAGWPPFMSGIQTFNNAGWGIYSTTFLNISGIPSFLNNDRLGEIYFGLTGSIQGGWIADCYIQFAGSTATWGVNPTAPGIYLAPNASPLVMENLQFFNVQGNSVEFYSGGHMLALCQFEGAGQGGVFDHTFEIYGSNTGTTGPFHFSENLFLNPTFFGGSGFGHSLVGNYFAGNAAGQAMLTIAGGTDWIIANNFIINVSATGFSLLIYPGVTYLPGENLCFGLVQNGGSKSGNTYTLS